MEELNGYILYSNILNCIIITNLNFIEIKVTFGMRNDNSIVNK
jgi:hypothetical protein